MKTCFKILLLIPLLGLNACAAAAGLYLIQRPEPTAGSGPPAATPSPSPQSERP